jgi:hypothetical protein
MAKVRVKSIYAFQPVGLDLFDNPLPIPSGSIVRVVNKFGCPPANTMGHCYIEHLDGKFIGMCLCNSLIPMKRVGKKFFMK